MGKKLVFVLAMLNSIWLNGQTLNYTNIPCGFIDFRALESDNNGNFYAAGNVLGTVDFNPTAGFGYVSDIGGTTMYLVKFNSIGQIQWIFPLELGDGNSSDTYPISINFDNTGNLILTGRFNNSGVDMDPGPGNYPINSYAQPFLYSYFIAKYSSSGQLIWAKSMGDDILVHDVALDNNDNIYITAGTTGDDMVPGPQVISMPVLNMIDRCLLKLDSAGNYLWAKIFTSSSYSTSPSKILIGNDNRISIVGDYATDIDFDPGPGVHIVPNLGGYISKYDTSGNFIWVKPFYNASMYLQTFRMDNECNIFLSGHFDDPYIDFNLDSTAVFALGTNGLKDIFIAKYDSAGNFDWVISAGGPGLDYGYDFDLDNSGNCMITGHFQSDSIDFDPSPATFYYQKLDSIFFTNFTAFYDSSGNFIRVFGINGTDPSTPYIPRNTVLPNGELVMAGMFEPPVDFDPGPGVTNSGACLFGGFIMKYGTQFLGVNEINELNSLSLFPNPAEGEFNVQFESTKNEMVEISIADMQGRLLKITRFNAIIGMNLQTFSTSELASGLYFVRIMSENSQSTKKLIIKK